MIIDAQLLELLLPSIIITAVISVTAGLLSNFVAWRSMAFFSDALSHSAILGTSLAFILNVHVLAGLIAYGIIVALLLANFSHKISVGSDSFLAILSQSSLALGLLALGFAPSSLSIEALLFGDILSVTHSDILPNTLICALILGITLFIHKTLIRLCLDTELAQVEGINIRRYESILMLLLVSVIATGIQLLGVLLISSMLLMPAASARNLSKSPQQMLWLAPLISLVSALLGLFISVAFDNLATGPCIVISAALIWLMTQTHNKKNP